MNKGTLISCYTCAYLQFNRNFNRYFKQSIPKGNLHGFNTTQLIYASTTFAKYKWYMTNQANVDNHRTR